MQQLSLRPEETKPLLTDADFAINENTPSSNDNLPPIECYTTKKGTSNHNEEILSSENFHYLKPGDVVKLGRYYGLPHQVVIEEVLCCHEPCRIKAIHYGRPNLRTPNRVIREEFTLKKCRLCHFSSSWCYPPEVVVQRARSRLNEEQHSVKNNRASHFVRWCKTISPCHRANNLVPIYLSNNHHIHEVKIGDHLNFKCDSEKTLHGEVVQKEILTDSKFLLTLHVSLKEMSEQSVSFAHKRKHEVVDPVSVIRLESVSKPDLALRFELLENLSFRKCPSSFEFCYFVTNPKLSADKWRDSAGYTLIANTPAPQCESIRVKPDELREGDIILTSLDNEYGVITDIEGQMVTTLQYSVAEETVDDQRGTLKLVIKKEENDAVLCVHNDSEVDCPLKKLDHGSNLSQMVGEKRVTPQSFKYLKAGDVLRIQYYKLNHKIVIEEVSYNNTGCEITTIHYGRPNLHTPNRVIREIFTFKIVSSAGTRQLIPECWLCHFPTTWCHPPNVVVERARSRLNEQEHCPFTNRASHFVRWCKTKCSSHRPNNLVPIYLSEDHHIHEVKIGDHLNFKCNSGKCLHGEVVQATELCDSKQLLELSVSLSEVKSKQIAFVNKVRHNVSSAEPVTVVTSVPQYVGDSDLSSRIELVKTLVFKEATSTYAFALFLTNPNLIGDDWKRKVGCDLRSDEGRPICLKVPPANLKKGDIVFLKDVYRVISDTQNDNDVFKLTTVQYCMTQQNPDDHLQTLKLVIDKHETDAQLCVHNDAKLDCHLHGGGRDKPSYTYDRVSDTSLRSPWAASLV